MIAGFPFFVVMCVALLGMVAFSQLAYRIDRDASAGNCWSYALARWVKFGGYLAIRPAGDVYFLRVLPILHCIWIQSLGPSELRMTAPRRRMKGWAARWLPWEVPYFKLRVVDRDSPQPPASEP